jgi:hypothetical protein
MCGFFGRWRAPWAATGPVTSRSSGTTHEGRSEAITSRNPIVAGQHVRANADAMPMSAEGGYRHRGFTLTNRTHRHEEHGAFALAV